MSKKQKDQITYKVPKLARCPVAGCGAAFASKNRHFQKHLKDAHPEQPKQVRGICKPKVIHLKKEAHDGSVQTR